VCADYGQGLLSEWHTWLEGHVTGEADESGCLWHERNHVSERLSIAHHHVKRQRCRVSRCRDAEPVLAYGIRAQSAGRVQITINTASRPNTKVTSLRLRSTRSRLRNNIRPVNSSSGRAMSPAFPEMEPIPLTYVRFAHCYRFMVLRFY
jgi:hypothetical protein